MTVAVGAASTARGCVPKKHCCYDASFAWWPSAIVRSWFFMQVMWNVVFAVLLLHFCAFPARGNPRIAVVCTTAAWRSINCTFNLTEDYPGQHERSQLRIASNMTTATVYPTSCTTSDPIDNDLLLCNTTSHNGTSFSTIYDIAFDTNREFVGRAHICGRVTSVDDADMTAIACAFAVVPGPRHFLPTETLIHSLTNFRFEGSALDSRCACRVFQPFLTCVCLTLFFHALNGTGFGPLPAVAAPERTESQTRTPRTTANAAT